jgi:hypothetical protein
MIFPEQLDEEDMSLFTREAKLAGYIFHTQRSQIASNVIYRTFHSRDDGPVFYTRVGERDWQLTVVGQVRENERKAYRERRKNREDQDSSIPA